jgi:hypothetical protein
MKRAPRAPHSDTLEEALPHFNESFRKRYRLPSVTVQELRAVPGLEEDLAELATVRANGVMFRTRPPRQRPCVRSRRSPRCTSRPTRA